VQPANERIFERIQMISNWNVKPSNDYPRRSTLNVTFGITVLCAELDEYNRHLRTHAWQSMVRKANGEQSYDEYELGQLGGLHLDLIKIPDSHISMDTV